MTTDWRPITERPPLKTPVELRNAAGVVVIGQALYDGILGRRGYWYWDTAVPVRGALRKFEPVAWRSFAKPSYAIVTDKIGRREVECLLERAILTERTYRRPGHKKRASPLADMRIEDDGNQDILRAFSPEPWDHANHDIVAVWITKMTAEQRLAVWLRAYGLSFDRIGDRLGRSQQTARNHYAKGIEKAWRLAFADSQRLRRLPRDEWAPRKGGRDNQRQASTQS